MLLILLDKIDVTRRSPVATRDGYGVLESSPLQFATTPRLPKLPGALHHLARGDNRIWTDSGNGA
jgi:hypothetical protein